MADVAVILPCRGRHDQTLAYAARLRAAAGDVAASWWAVSGQDDADTVRALRAAGWEHWIGEAPSLSYWEALARATRHSQAPVLCAVANDLWSHDRWLQLGLGAYRARFADGEGLLGFAGDGHPVGHSCHFLIGRRLLGALGGWPTHYRHNFGDAELCARAQQLGRYAKARHAVLEHRHPILQAAPDDAVYAAGRAAWAQDEQLFYARKARNWT